MNTMRIQQTILMHTDNSALTKAQRTQLSEWAGSLVYGTQKNDIHMKKNKLDPCFLADKEINSKWVKGLSVQTRTLILLEGKVCQDIAVDRD